MNRKIWKALGIAVCMLALAAPRAMAARYEVGMDDPFIKFGDAVQEINNKSSDEKNEIVLMQDITLGGNPNEYTLYTLSRGNTTIKGGGNKITISNAGITVTGEKTTLNLGEKGYKGTLTIDGKTSGGFITVSGRATANMYENVTLQNGEFAGNACVVVKGLKLGTGPNSAFNMDGGVIEKCSRAVIVDSGATFNMSRGEIRNCGGDRGRGSGNGGGVRVYGATFVMSGGTISGCTADNGGGLCAEESSTVTISGGTISGCKGLLGGGLYADHSTITISDGTISGSTISGCSAGAGGGLYATNSSEITISGSTISGCSAGAGGSLYATNSSEITISGGTISECTAADNGGGLYATNQSTITISDGIISRCKAQAYDGGGLYATNQSTINISGGTISGCDGRWGGGLYAENSSTIEISGGTISGCKKVGAGGGLFVVGSTIRISGGIISGCITSDTGNGGGLYAKDSTIKITGGRIENNKAALGGGVALIGKTTFEKPITNWTVIGNEAYATGGVGGGIKLEKGLMNVSDGSNRIYNNTADGHGADICLTDDTSSIKLPNAAGMGATFGDSGINIDGWYNDNPPYKPSENVKPVENLQLSGKQSLVASYTVIPVRIEIDANGGVGGSVSQTVHKGTNVTLEAPTKEGHLFKGWEDKEKGNSYPAGEDGKVNITVNENMKLTAVWKARTFTVTYVLLNGETRTETVNYGETVTLGEELRTGYTFVGWKDGENVHQAGETITVTGDMTLTAVWEARTFTVTYVLLNGETRAETVDYGKTVTLGEEPRTGYTFVGWKDGEKMYHAGETITVTGDMTLTAEWKKLPSAENLPKTGDESPVLLWGAALAVSAAACFMLRRKK